MTDRDHLLRVLDETGWKIKGASGAAARIGHTAPTIRRQMRLLGIVRPPRPPRASAPKSASRNAVLPRAPAPVESHPPVAMLLHSQAGLRARAQLIVRTYLPGPERTTMLRRLEAQQIELREAIRGLLGNGESQQGMVRAPCAPGALRPAWELASTWYW
jgi:hypothetical protein